MPALLTIFTRDPDLTVTALGLNSVLDKIWTNVVEWELDACVELAEWLIVCALADPRARNKIAIKAINKLKALMRTVR